jgi:hypothetical protein
MKIYIQYESKFYICNDWDIAQRYPSGSFFPIIPALNPKFISGDRVYWEDTKMWTEVENGDSGSCPDCVRFSICSVVTAGLCAGIIFKAFDMTAEQVAPLTFPNESTSILFSERNQIAFGFMKSLLNNCNIARASHSTHEYRDAHIEAAFALADIFIERAKRGK